MKKTICGTVALVVMASCAPVDLPQVGEAGGPALTSFAIVSPPTEGAVDAANRAVSALVPWNTDCSSLVAAFTFSGQRVTVAGVEQASGVTPNDFSKPVEYVIECSDGSCATYTATVIARARPSEQKSITAFSFLRPPVVAAIDEARHAISAVVPRGTDVSALVACFTTTGVGVRVAGTPQESGVTANDFTDPVGYMVAAEDGSTQVYVVAVTEAPGQEKAITAFTVQAPGAAAAIDEEQKVIRVRVAEGTPLTGLVAEFTTTGASVKVGGVPQQSGVTANDFTAPVSYEVKAEDGTTALYSVRVTDRVRLVVNELDIDQVGTDNSEFIELYASGAVDLWGIVVVLVNGGVTPGQEYSRTDLSSQGTLPAGSYLAVAGPLVPVAPGGIKYTPPGWELTNRIQNGPNDAVLIWDTLGRRVVDTVSYSGVLHRAVIAGEPGELDATEGSAGASADSNSVVGSIARSPNGQDTGQNGADFKFVPTLTPGGPNP